MAFWNLVANVCQITYLYFQAIFSRVARVCKSDQGGPHKFRDNWTSFLKTRLNCSIPGEHPFYFDEVQATSGLIDGHLVYGVFTTPDNSISGSAICAFSLKDITQRYVKPHFLQPFTDHSVWKFLKISHLNFWILVFSINFCVIKTDFSGNTASSFQKFANIDHGHVEWDFFFDFQTLWCGLIWLRGWSQVIYRHSNVWRCMFCYTSC